MTSSRVWVEGFSSDVAYIVSQVAMGTGLDLPLRRKLYCRQLVPTLPFFSRFHSSSHSSQPLWLLQGWTIPALVFRVPLFLTYPSHSAQPHRAIFLQLHHYLLFRFLPLCFRNLSSCLHLLQRPLDWPASFLAVIIVILLFSHI